MTLPLSRLTHMEVFRNPSLLVEYQTPPHVLMEFIIEHVNSSEILTLLKATSDAFNQERMLINILSHETHKSMHAMEHGQWWNSMIKY